MPYIHTRAYVCLAARFYVVAPSRKGGTPQTVVGGGQRAVPSWF